MHMTRTLTSSSANRLADRKVLTVALAALLAGSGAAMAQTAAGSAEAKVRTDITADAAVRDARAARAEAEAARRAAEEAENARRSGALTAEGAAQAEYSSYQADQASKEAETASHTAINAANAANAARTAAHGGTALPDDATIRAQQAARQARAAAQAAGAAASTATLAASDAQDAVMATPELDLPPASTMAVPAPTYEVVTVTSSPGDPARTHFTALDSNRDGFIDRSEAAADAELSARFDRLAAGGEGRLSFEAYKAWRDAK
ncbi:hypothetical protein BH23PSE2_BH23PSE2_03250 [soil metagenome]